MPTTATAGTARQTGADPATPTATIEFNICNSRMPWLLRRYGARHGTIARGVPASFATEADAIAARDAWIGSGQ
ncbi:hypothetical protein [Sphingomonas sp. HMP6]|uniref:hypothetical protein n=1 Tax=Sphingomonas sp. HMP6 TaxID=1517551 RepID=UPI001596847E|nr:hypothetical protein [Sphingomonas sp. HMP6]BCA57721.1 hypothetical protein HMP06_0490 [Sphingomonas sp. HMP6]